MHSFLQSIQNCVSLQSVVRDTYLVIEFYDNRFDSNTLQRCKILYNSLISIFIYIQKRIKGLYSKHLL